MIRASGIYRGNRRAHRYGLDNGLNSAVLRGMSTSVDSVCLCSGTGSADAPRAEWLKSKLNSNGGRPDWHSFRPSAHYVLTLLLALYLDR
jgi:hypothetical protein